MNVEVTIDPNICMASGNCSFWAKNTFDLPDDMNHSIVVDPRGDDIEKVLGAARACPTQAIKVWVEGDRLH